MPRIEGSTRSWGGTESGNMNYELPENTDCPGSGIIGLGTTAVREMERARFFQVPDKREKDAGGKNRQKKIGNQLAGRSADGTEPGYQKQIDNAQHRGRSGNASDISAALMQAG